MTTGGRVDARFVSGGAGLSLSSRVSVEDLWREVKSHRQEDMAMFSDSDSEQGRANPTTRSCGACANEPRVLGDRAPQPRRG